MEASKLEKLGRLVRLSLGMNVVMLVINLAMAYLLVIFVINEPSEIEGVDPFAAQVEAEDETDPKVELQDFFKRTSDLLDRVVRKHGANPTDFLPSNKEIDDAIETRTIHSDESQAVVQKLREGYDYFDMDWPIVMPKR